MKSLFFTFVFNFLFISCDGPQESKNQDTSIVGTWKLIETFGSDGASNPIWRTLRKEDNAYIYTFKDDGTFTTTWVSDCSYGTYEINSSAIMLDFECKDFKSSLESPDGKIIENYVIEDGKLILTPAYLLCIEGCGFKFEKIK